MGERDGTSRQSSFMQWYRDLLGSSAYIPSTAYRGPEQQNLLEDEPVYQGVADSLSSPRRSSRPWQSRQHLGMHCNILANNGRGITSVIFAGEFLISKTYLKAELRVPNRRYTRLPPSRISQRLLQKWNRRLYSGRYGIPPPPSHLTP